MTQLSLWAGSHDHVSHLVLPGSEKAKKMTVRSGRKCCVSLKKSGPLGSLARMLLESSIWNSTRCYLTWKVQVLKHRRLLYQLAVSMPGTDGTGFGFLPTMRVTDTEVAPINNAELIDGSFSRKNEKGVRWGIKLRDVLENGLLPTPTEMQVETSKEKFLVRQARQKAKKINGNGCGSIKNSKEHKTKLNNKDVRANAQCGSWWQAEPGVGRVVHGLPGRVDRLRGLGNSIVPEIAYIFFEMIKQIENNK